MNVCGSELPKAVLLAVLAHPDDETFGTGGTLAVYASRGAAVFLVCATRGEVGEMKEEYLNGYGSSADRRSAELRCASLKLGLAGIHFLPYRDSGMPGSPENHHPQALTAQPVEKVAADIVHFMRMLKPQVVITFDPMGGYKHPDHIAIHQATNLAFRLAGEKDYLHEDGLPPHRAQKLYYQVISRRFMRWGIAILKILGKNPRQFGTNKDIDLVAIAETEFPVHAAIDYRSVANIREQAAACHESQGGKQQSNGFMAWLRRLTAGKDTYMRAFPPPTEDLIENDLFDLVVFDELG
jgi:LmbE family N-acetylglucosaminyl deacetylase